jgi:hypothetical protein
LTRIVDPIRNAATATGYAPDLVPQLASYLFSWLRNCLGAGNVVSNSHTKYIGIGLQYPVVHPVNAVELPVKTDNNPLWQFNSHSGQ